MARKVRKVCRVSSERAIATCARTQRRLQILFAAVNAVGRTGAVPESILGELSSRAPVQRRIRAWLEVVAIHGGMGYRDALADCDWESAGLAELDLLTVAGDIADMTADELDSVTKVRGHVAFWIAASGNQAV